MHVKSVVEDGLKRERGERERERRFPASSFLHPENMAFDPTDLIPSWNLEDRLSWREDTQLGRV